MIQQKVRDLILMNTKGVSPPDKVFISKADFKALMEETEEIYREQYAGFVVDKKASEEGYDNILFMGVAVCIDDTLDEK